MRMKIPIARTDSHSTVRWVAEGVVGALKSGLQEDADGKVLSVLLDVIKAILDNSTLFVEPYVSSV